ncbi:drebrin-like protein B isoform X2 [Dunckerocampus dactyliophorus]|uniref:drebrin-like protein B isoform X2 n=1 Tax=Dunckerocampus dactyliophorus TaxID=161453 RepID=UPI00240672B6|nr:drebrin-like protein B isoform X2 [Dunckerocampus dactyliophorus]
MSSSTRGHAPGGPGMRPVWFSPNRLVWKGRFNRRSGRPASPSSCLPAASNMAVNLSKNGAELMAAYKDVVDGRSDTNWALFTYEGNSNTIRLAGKGGGGLEEMVEELNSGKVMYAFCRVQDPNSGLPKYVLINWTGEGVKDSRKGMCANHLTSVANFLKGAHVTINARDEDDVEPDVILSKVSKASGSNYSVHKTTQQYGDAPRGPVGSVYRKTNAVEEIQQIDKDTFWLQAQREEEARRQQEVKKTDLQRQSLDKERRDTEEKQTRDRDKRAHERAALIDQQRMLQKLREEEERAKEEERQTQQEKENEWTGYNMAARVHAANEAEAVISQRSFNPRDVFKQREQSLNLDYGRAPSAPRAGKLQSPFLSQKPFETQCVLRPQTPPSQKPFEVPADLRPQTPPFQKPLEIQSNPHSWTPPSSSPPVTASPDLFHSHGGEPAVTPPHVADAHTAEEDDWSDEFDEDMYEAAPREAFAGSLLETLTAGPADVTFPPGADGNMYEAPLPADEHQRFEDVAQDASTAEDDDGGHNICAKAMYDYQAADDTEITFDPDDIITRIEMVDEGWWRGFGPDGHYGMFPANYVELL